MPLTIPLLTHILFTRQKTEEYTGLIFTTAKRLCNHVVPYEDTKQIGFLGLYKALDEYYSREHIKANYKENTYVALRIRSEIMNYMRDKSNVIRIPRSAIKNGEKIQMIDLYKEVNSSSYNPETLADYIIGEEINPYEQMNYENIIKRIKELLDYRDFEIFSTYFLEDRKDAVYYLSVRFGKTKSWVSKRKKKILEHLRENLEYAT